MTVDTNVDYFITVGDWGKVLHATLRDSNRNPVDLSAASDIKIRCAKNVVDSPLFVGTCVKVADQVNYMGELDYTFANGNADTPGYYKAQFVATWIDARITFPTLALIFEITQELLSA